LRAWNLRGRARGLFGWYELARLPPSRLRGWFCFVFRLPLPDLFNSNECNLMIVPIRMSNFEQ